MKCCAFAVVTFAIILESVCAQIGETCLNIVNIGKVDYFGAFTEYTKENIIGTPRIYEDSNEPTSTWNKYRTDVIVFTEDNSTKTLEEVEEDIIMESAYHRNGTIWMSTSNGVYKYTQGDVRMTLYTINDNLSSRAFKQLTTLNDTLNLVLESDKVQQIIDGKFLIDCPPKLLTGYHIAVDPNCGVYYVKTYYHFRNAQSYTAKGFKTDSSQPSFVVDYHNNKVFRSYPGGFYFHSPEDVRNITERSVTYADVIDMAIDNQSNIFILTSNELYVFFPVQNASCTFSDPTGASLALFPPPEKLEEYKQRSRDIISEDSCIERSFVKKTNVTLIATLIAFLAIGLFSLALALVAASKMIVRRFGSKKRTPGVKEPVNLLEINCNGVYEGHDYESIVYDQHYEIVDADVENI